MQWGVVEQATGMFAVTNVDDLVLLALFFGQASAGRRGGAGVVVGQYLGFAAILVVSVVGALGAGLLPESAIPYLGMVPLLLGVRAGWRVWRGAGEEAPPEALTALSVAAVTFANGGDNIGVYVPVFTSSGRDGLVVFVVVFLLLVGVWCAAGRFLATRQVIASALARWGHVVLPVVLIGIGVVILAGA